VFIVMAISGMRGWARDAVVSFHSAADLLVILPVTSITFKARDYLGESCHASCQPSDTSTPYHEDCILHLKQR